MKIIVSHPGTQHVRLLLSTVLKEFNLVKFFTVFASFGWLYAKVPDKMKKELKKRMFINVPRNNIIHFPLLFFVEKFFFKTGIRNYKYGYTFFDWMVSKKVKYATADVIIGYENANLHTFSIAKKKGMTTVLDLAHIHHTTSTNISYQYDLLKSRLISDSDQNWMNNKKDKALIFTDYIFVLSNFAKDSLITNGISEKSIFLINLPVNQELFHPKKVYTSNKTMTFLFVGTITKLKGLEILLEAFKRLKLPNAELVLIGPMADGAELLEQYKGLYRYHSFMHHEDLANEYRAADVFVFPSYLDSWAQTVVEAMACGTPAIVSENTGAKDAVKQGGGFVVRTGDVDALKDSMLHLYEHRCELEQIGRKAAKVATRYTVGNYQNQIIEALEQITDEKNKG